MSQLGALLEHAAELVVNDEDVLEIREYFHDVSHADNARRLPWRTHTGEGSHV